MNLLLSLFSLLLWVCLPQTETTPEQDSRITQIEILPESSQTDLDQMVNALADDQITLTFSQIAFKAGKLDQIEGRIQFDEDHEGTFSAQGLIRVKITWEWKGDALENLEIMAEGEKTNKNVSTNH